MAKIAQLKTETNIADEMISYAEVSTAARLRIIVDGKSPLLTHNPESMGGQAPHGTARQGFVCFDAARLGEARRGIARLGMASPGEVRQGREL